MATLEQIGKALKNAAAAGDTAAAAKLATAYKAARAQQAVPPSPAISGDAAMAGPAAPNPQASQLPGMLGQFQNTSNALQSGFNQGMTLGFGDELYAGATAPIRALGPLFQGQGYDIGKAYNDELATVRQTNRDQSALNPVASTTGEVMGSLVGPGKGLGFLKGAKSLGGLALRGGLEGAAQGAAYGFGSADGDVNDRLSHAGAGALTGAAAGAVLPVLAKKGGDVVESVLQNRATSAAIKGAPSAADLKAASSAMFKSVDQSGVTVDAPRFSQFVNNLASQAKRDRINPNLDPKAFSAYQELIGALDDIQKNGGALTISDLHTLRQIAQKAAVSAEGRDSMFANRIVDGIDQFVVSPGALKPPANRLGSGNPTDAGNAMLQAISTWSRARRSGLIEEAIYKAGNQASGLENGLRIQFRQLLQNPRTRNQFSKAEQQALERVANGTVSSNLVKLIGKFGFGPNNMLGGSIGATLLGAITAPLGPVAQIAATGAGMAATAGARKASEAMTRAAAERAGRVVATPNIPNVTLRNPLPQIPWSGLSLPIIDAEKRKPVQITVRGGRQ